MSTRAERAGSAAVARRLALRSVFAYRGRSMLIAAMIAIPVAGTVVAGTVAAATQPTPAELVTTQLGRMQGEMEVVSRPDRSIVQDPSYVDHWNGNGDQSATAPFRTPSDVLPAGTRILQIGQVNATVQTATGIGSLAATVGDTWDARFAGRFDLTAGRAPRTDHEILASRAALARLGVPIGGTVTVLKPHRESLTVVGVLNDRTVGRTAEQLFGTAAAFGAVLGPEDGAFYLPSLSLSWAEVQRIDRDGITTLSRSVALDPPPVPKNVFQTSSGGDFLVLGVAVGAAFLLFEVVLLAGAAFAVTARQQQRMLATAATVGADRRTLVRVTTMSGLLLGAIGGLTGTAIGLLGGTIAMAATSDGSATQFYGWHFPLLAVASSVALAIGAGWLAALLPARAAARVEVLTALRGSRRPVGAGKRPLLGLALLVVGAALGLLGGILLAALNQYATSSSKIAPVALLIVGPLMTQIGAALCAPLLLTAIGRLAGRGVVSIRLASRDLARNRPRSLPAVAAIMTTVFLGVFVMCIVNAGNDLTIRDYQWNANVGQVTAPLRYQASPDEDVDSKVVDPAAAAAAARSTLGPGDVRVLAAVPDPANDFSAAALKDRRTLYPTLDMEADCGTCSDVSPYLMSLEGAGGHIFVGDADDLAAALGHPASSDARQALASGGAVVLLPHYLRHGTTRISWWTAAQLSNGDAFTTAHPTRVTTLPAVADYPAHSLPYGIFVSQQTAARTGLVAVPTTLIATPRSPATTAQVDRLNQQLGALQNSPYGAQVLREDGPDDIGGLAAWIALAVCAIIIVASAAAAVGLARIDGRPDADTLAAIGAGPLLQRANAFWLALLVCAVGAVIGAALALLPALALGLPGESLVFDPPWLQIAALALVLPVTIAAASAALAPRRRTVVRRTAIA